MGIKHHSFVEYRNLTELVERAGERYPNTGFFISGDKSLKSISRSELLHCCRAFAHLERTGGRQGEHIAILGKNCAAWITAFFAVVAGGAVAVPLSKDARTDELSYCVNKADCSVLYI